MARSAPGRVDQETAFGLILLALPFECDQPAVCGALDAHHLRRRQQDSAAP